RRRSREGVRGARAGARSGPCRRGPSRGLGGAGRRDRAPHPGVAPPPAFARAREERLTAALIFWIAVLLLAYAYAGYPVLVTALAALRPRPARARPIEPSVTIVVAARDEEERIGARVRNLLALDYPRDRLEIVIGSDGSRDLTAARGAAAARG